MTKARDLANIISGGFTDADIPNLPASKITSGTLDNARITLDAAEIPNLDTAKITTGTMADARISAGSVTQHVSPTDLTPVRQDILTLALKQAVEENHTKYNLTNSAICKFEADADFNLAGSTNLAREDNEFIRAVQVSNDANCLELFNFDAISLSGGATQDCTGNTYASKRGLLEINETGNNSQFIANYNRFDANGNVTTTGNHGACLSAENGGWNNGSRGFTVTTVSGQTSPLDFGTGAFTVECWTEAMNASYPSAVCYYFDMTTTGSSNRIGVGQGSPNNTSISGQFMPSPFSMGHSYFGSGSNYSWRHSAYVRDASGNHAYFNQGSRQNVSGSTDQTDLDYTSGNIHFLEAYNGNSSVAARCCEIRFSDVARYDPTQTSYTMPSTNFKTTQTIVNATGTALGTTNVPSSPVTDVSGVMLLKNLSGTNTLGTDVKVFFTADNSNFTEATSYADAGTFSTGIKMIKLGKTTCTQGSDVRWKIVFANQVNASKVAEIYGIGVNY